MTENQEELDPLDLTEEIEWRLGLDLTDLHGEVRLHREDSINQRLQVRSG